jgi:integrase
MSSVFKRARDRKRPGAAWYIAFTDENGIRRTRKGCPDKAATEGMARKLESEAELRRRGVIDARTDAYATHEVRPLADHLADFHVFLTGKGSTPEHANLTRNRVARLIELAHARRVSDLAPSRVQAALKTIRDEGISLRSVHHYTRAVKGFSRWLWRDGRAREDTLAHLTSQNPDSDRRHERRALTPDEMARLFLAAERGGVVLTVTGPDRAALYRVAAGTGFRANELRSLAPESFDLDAGSPTVTVAAAYSKRRRDDVQPIRPDLAEALRPWVASRTPGRPVFGKLTRRTAEMIRVDLEAAGIAYETSSGVADFHALRHSYITALAMSRAPVKVIQSLARHSSPVLTLGTYAHVGLYDQTAALDALPGPTAAGLEAETIAATGTDPVSSFRQILTAQGQRAGDGTGRELADAGGTDDVYSGRKGVLPMDRNPRGQAGLDGTRRVPSAPDGARGAGRIRTAGDGFADRCLTTWRQRRKGQ